MSEASYLHKRPTYIRIHCERKRAQDFEARSWGRREVMGKTFARYEDGRWVCSCCKTPVAVVW